MSKTLSHDQQVAILLALSGTNSPRLAIGNVAHHHDVTVADIMGFVTKHGWPNPTSMGRAASAMRQQQSPTPQPRPVPKPPRPSREIQIEVGPPEPAPLRRTVPQPRTPSETLSLDMSVNEILERASRSKSGNTRSRIEPLRKKVQRLLDILANEDRAEFNRRRLALQQEHARKQVAEAEMALKKARDQAKGLGARQDRRDRVIGHGERTRAALAKHGLTGPQARALAIERGMVVATAGLMPAEVVKMLEDAEPGTLQNQSPEEEP